MGAGDALEGHSQNPLLTAFLQQRGTRLAEESLGTMIVDRHGRVMLGGNRLQIAQGVEAPFFEIGVL